MLHRIICLLLFLLNIASLSAQSSEGHAADVPDVFAGRLHRPYTADVGTPPYYPDNYQLGSLTFRGRHFDSVYLRLDVYTRYILVLLPKRDAAIEYLPTEVSDVVIGGHPFRYMPKGSGVREGWYETTDDGVTQRVYISNRNEVTGFTIGTRPLRRSLPPLVPTAITAEDYTAVTGTTTTTTDTTAATIGTAPAESVATTPEDVAPVETPVPTTPSESDALPASRRLGEAYVTTRRRGTLDNVLSTQLGANQLTHDEMLTVPTVFGEHDVMRIIETLPGVKTMGEGANGLSVRGGSTDQNLIRWGESTIYNPTHLFGMFSALNGALIDRVDLYKNNFPARYGGRLSSVLAMDPRYGNRDHWSGTLSLGLLTSSASVEGPLGSERTSLLAAARTTYSDWMLGILPESSGYQQGKAGFYDGNVLVSHRFDENNTLQLSAYGSRDRFNFRYFEHYGYTNANGAITYGHSFRTGFSTTLSAGMDHYDYSTSRFDNPADAYKLQYSLNQIFLRSHFLHQTLPHQSISWGAEAIGYDVMPGRVEPYSSESLYVPRSLAHEKAFEGALYAQHEWTPTAALAVSLGARAHFYMADGAHYLGPELRGAVRYAFTPAFSVKAGVSTMRQAIHLLTNTYVASPTDIWQLSGSAIRPQTGTQYSLGLYHDFEEGNVQCSVEGYYKPMSNVLDYRAGAQLIMNPNLADDLVATKGKAYGIELLVKRQQGRINGWMSYTFARTFLHDHEGNSLSNGDAAWFVADYDRPHELKGVVNWQLTKRYSFTANVNYSTGRPLTVPTLQVYDHTFHTYSFIYTERNQTRLPDYFRLDLAFNIRPSHHLTKRAHSFFTIGCYNVTARRNVYSVFFEAKNGTIAGSKMSIFAAPIPYASVNIELGRQSRTSCHAPIAPLSPTLHSYPVDKTYYLDEYRHFDSWNELFVEILTYAVLHTDAEGIPSIHVRYGGLPAASPAMVFLNGVESDAASVLARPTSDYRQVDVFTGAFQRGDKRFSGVIHFTTY